MSRLKAAFFASLTALCALFALSLLATAGVSAAPGRVDGALPRQSAPFLPELGDPLSIDSIIAAQAPLTCTYTVTTPNSDVTNNFTFATAASLFTYNNLSLVEENVGASPTNPFTTTVKTQYFRVDALAGYHYLVTAVPNSLSTYNLLIVVYNSGQTPVLTSTKSLGNLSAAVDFMPATGGTYYFAVSHVASNCPSGTYKLTAEGPATSTPTATGSPTVTGSPTTVATALPGADRFEPNWGFDLAALIALDQAETNLNFVPAPGSPLTEPDNDFFKLWVKPGELVTCQTQDLSGFTDTNMIVYDNNRNGIDGSDDIDRANGNRASLVRYYGTYEGWLYILIGNVYPIEDPAKDAFKFTYTLLCSEGFGPTSTPTNTRVPVTPVPTNTPTPSRTPTSSPTLTPTPPFIQVRPLPTVTPSGQRTFVIPISLQVYYDLNNNRVPDPGEGVVGVSARVVDVTTGQELTHGFTDGFGFASLTVSAPGVVRLIVPYLNYSVVVQTSGVSLALRIAPYDLPIVIP